MAIADMDYQATFGIAGRLKVPLQEIKRKDIAAWSRHHPNGLVVTKVKNAAAIPEAAQAFRYRGRWLVLREARRTYQISR
ncbi:MAG: hypothetical protein KDI01_03665 [Halioglobus sp.]|nr:hypothetical protein [Halioglobus sp.]